MSAHPRTWLFAFLVQILLLVDPGEASAASEIRDPGSVQRPSTQTIFLPVGDLFKPLLADLKQPRFFISYRRYIYSDQAVDISSVGVGELFGLYRSVDPADGAGWQVSFGGGLRAQFNLDTASKDLLNTDYFFGIPLAYRKGALSSRVYLYHQSSHLGDEFLLHANPTRMEFSYEALNVIESYERNEWRGYVGGEVILRKEPRELKTLSAQIGIEYYGSSPVWRRGIPVGGFDLKSTEEHDWAVNSSAVVGLEFRGNPPGNNRYIRVLLEGYKGFNPHGQFYVDHLRISYYGAGVYWGF